MPTVETTRYTMLLQLITSCRHSALFVGGSGVGKSAIMLDALNKMQVCFVSGLGTQDKRGLYTSPLAEARGTSCRAYASG